MALRDQLVVELPAVNNNYAYKSLYGTFEMYARGEVFDEYNNIDVYSIPHAEWFMKWHMHPHYNILIMK